LQTLDSVAIIGFGEQVGGPAGAEAKEEAPRVGHAFDVLDRGDLKRHAISPARDVSVTGGGSGRAHEHEAPLEEVHVCLHAISPLMHYTSSKLQLDCHMHMLWCEYLTQQTL
jgi:hypothetical protein